MSLIIVHITDFHMQAKVERNPILRKAEAIGRVCSSVASSYEDIVFALTGDIAFSGKTSEYENCIDLLEDIQKYIKTQINADIRIIVSPGNHDCDFSGNQATRNALIKHVKQDNDFVDDEIVRQISIVQKNFWDFASLYNKDYIIDGPIVKSIELDVSVGKVLINLVNTAWMSEIEEKPGTLILPKNLLPEIDFKKYNLVITMAHHPVNWMHPDNAVIISEFFRKSTDLLIYGHEHRLDNLSTSGVMAYAFNFEQINGCEIQNSTNATKSAFSIYCLDNNLSMLRSIYYKWDEEQKTYMRRSLNEEIFKKNTYITNQALHPNREYMRFLNDLGILVHHFQVEKVALDDLFCWPDLDIIDIKKFASQQTTRTIRENIPEHILKNNITLILGHSLSGKTSLAKSLYKLVISSGKCCILWDGSIHSSTNTERTLEELFINQYTKDRIDEFWLMDKKDRILIIDNFEEIRFTDEQRSKVIGYLNDKFSRCIFISDTEIELPILIAIKNIIGEDNFAAFRIRNLGNIKRRELIEKWYRLGSQFGLTIDIENKIQKAKDTINNILGKYQNLVPGIPISIINILQSLEGVGIDSFRGSEFGYYYQGLINASLRAIPETDTGTTNLYVSILSNIAYDMLISKTRAFTIENIIQTVNMFNEEMLSEIDSVSLVKKMELVGILHRDDNQKYRFAYPYIFYYFAGRYIANNLQKDEVKNQVEYMSVRLYNETYGNVMIFVCHFTKNSEVIEDVLINAYSLFPEAKPFDFRRKNSLLDKANSFIERILLPKAVGSEEDVSLHQMESLKKKDELGIQDGSIDKNLNERLEDEDAGERLIRDFISSLKTIDVLGQILKNYPGDIEGKDKIAMIKEIHNLGMRVIQFSMEAVGYFEEDIVRGLAESVKESDKSANIEDIVFSVKGLFAGLIGSMVRGIISHIAYAIANDNLKKAARTALCEDGLISGILIMQDILFNYLCKPDCAEAISLYQHLEREKLDFAATVHRSIIAQYLLLNKCGREHRDRLCSIMGFLKTAMLNEAEKAKKDA